MALWFRLRFGKCDFLASDFPFVAMLFGSTSVGVCLCVIGIGIICVFYFLENSILNVTGRLCSLMLTDNFFFS